jgi:AcrR family transcriptional regulator
VTALARRTQEERSSATRTRLLEAAVDALIEHGIAGASLPEICRRAGVSRGAQLHHFPTRAELLAAAVEHLFDLRHAAFRARMAASPPQDVDEALAELWSIYTSGPLYAWLELVNAARTDAELRRHVVAVDARFEDEATVTMSSLFGLEADAARTAARLVTSLLDGLATHRILAPDDRVARDVLTLFAATLKPRLGGR